MDLLALVLIYRMKKKGDKKAKKEESVLLSEDESYGSTTHMLYFMEKRRLWWKNVVVVPLFSFFVIATFSLLIAMAVTRIVTLIVFFALSLFTSMNLFAVLFFWPAEFLWWMGREAFDEEWNYRNDWQETFAEMKPRQARREVASLRTYMNSIVKQLRNRDRLYLEIRDTFNWDYGSVLAFSDPANRTMILSYVQDTLLDRRPTGLEDVKTAKLDQEEQVWMFAEAHLRNITKVWHDGCPKPGMLTEESNFIMGDGSKQSAERVGSGLANKANGLIPYAMNNSIIYVVMPSGPRFSDRPVLMEYGPADLFVRLAVTYSDCYSLPGRIYTLLRLNKARGELPVYVGGYLRVWTLAESMMGVIHGRVSLSTVTKQRIAATIGVIKWCITICEEQARWDFRSRGRPEFINKLHEFIRGPGPFYKVLRSPAGSNVQPWYLRFAEYYEEIEKIGPFGMAQHLKIALREVLTFVALIDAADSSVPKEIVEEEFLRRMEDAPLGVEWDRLPVVGMAACLLRQGGKGLHRVSGLIRKLRTFEVDRLGEGAISLVGDPADWDAIKERISTAERIQTISLALRDNKAPWLLTNPEYAMESWVGTSVGDSFMGNISGWSKKYDLLKTLRDQRGLVNEFIRNDPTAWTVTSGRDRPQTASGSTIVEMAVEKPWDPNVDVNFINEKTPEVLLKAREDSLRRLEEALASKKRRMVPLLGKDVPWFYDPPSNSAILYVAVISEKNGILELVIPPEGTPPVLHAELENGFLDIELESEVANVNQQPPRGERYLTGPSSRKYNTTEVDVVTVPVILQLVLNLSNEQTEMIAFRRVRREETVGRIPLPIGYLQARRPNESNFHVPYSDVMTAGGEIMDHADDYEVLEWNERMTRPGGFRRDGNRLLIRATDLNAFTPLWATQVLESWNRPWRSVNAPEIAVEEEQSG